MDTKKWKSILAPRDVYLEIKEMAYREGRTISGQLRFIYEKYCEDHEPNRPAPKSRKSDKGA